MVTISEVIQLEYMAYTHLRQEDNNKGAAVEKHSVSVGGESTMLLQKHNANYGYGQWFVSRRIHYF